MRISDWSSDVCSSDLLVAGHPLQESLDLIHDFDLGSHALRRVAANAKDCINRFKRWHPGCPIRDADLLRLASLHAAIMVQFLSESFGQLQWNPSHRTRRIKAMFFLLSHSPLSLIRDRSNPQQRIRLFRSEEPTYELQSL